MRIDQTKSGMRVQLIPRVRMLVIVTMKFTAPATVETVRRWSDRIQRSCPLPGAWIESGGYAVQPVSAAPPFGEEAQHEHGAAEDEEPVRERVQPRERHVRGADHERHEEVREPGEDRDADEEDHRRSVDRDELVVAIRPDDVRVRLRELEAHDERHQPGEDEEDERGRDVEDPDPLVIRRDEPARDLAALPGWCGSRL